MLTDSPRLTNTEILIFITGKQGGTVHQIAEKLGVTASDIINADYERMQQLCRAAQTVRTQELWKIFESCDPTIHPNAAIRRLAIAERDHREEKNHENN